MAERPRLVVALSGRLVECASREGARPRADGAEMRDGVRVASDPPCIEARRVAPDACDAELRAVGEWVADGWLGIGAAIRRW
jgi:hypothetical protein